jgi:hypothetical protein
MTTPVGSGKNACFGFEDDHDSNQPLQCAAPRESLVCDGAPSPSESARTAAHSQSGGCAVSPDYYTVSGSAGFVVTAAVSATVDRYGHIYTAGGGGAGAGVGGAAHVGYLRDPDHPCEPPDEATLRSFLSGPAVSASGGAIVGVGVTHSSGMTARELGISTPQLGVTYTLGAEHER